MTIGDTGGLGTFSRVFDTFGFLGNGGRQDTTVTGLAGIVGTYFFELGTDANGCLNFASLTPAFLVSGSSYNVTATQFDLLCNGTVSTFSIPMQYRLELSGNGGTGRYTVSLTWDPVTPNPGFRRRFNVGGAIDLECVKQYDQTQTTRATGLSVSQTFSTLSGSFNGNGGSFYKLAANNESNGCTPDASTSGSVPEAAGSFLAEIVWL